LIMIEEMPIELIADTEIVLLTVLLRTVPLAGEVIATVGGVIVANVPRPAVGLVDVPCLVDKDGDVPVGCGPLLSIFRVVGWLETLGGP
jgi:hypothetical protein